MTRTPLIHSSLMLGVLLLAGCEQLDPYHRVDVWQPTGAPQANLAAMVADPHDLISGRGVSRADGKVADKAIGHVLQDTPKSLLDASGPGNAGMGGAGGSSGGGAGGAPGG